MIVSEYRYKFWRPRLRMGEKFHCADGNGYIWGGYYVNKVGMVEIMVSTREHKDKKIYVYLDFTYRGFSHHRNYGCIFSEHGLKMICSKFIKDIVKKYD